MTTRLKNRTWTNPQIENNKKVIKSDQVTDTKQKTRTHAFQIINTTNTICGENCKSS
jgi:hypothetical protein